MRKISALILLLLSAVSLLQAGETQLDKILEGDHRSAENKARDTYRHPKEVLTFFGIKPSMTVAEIYPGGGWYTEILAPYLKDKGQLVAVTYDRNPETQKSWMARVNKRFDETFAANPERYGTLKLTSAAAPNAIELGPEGGLDMIFDSRNVHNWLDNGEAMANAYFKALKKGGILAVIDHRMDADKPYNPKNGYVHEKKVIELMEAAGFKLEASSEINANPKDTKDHPKGVWTLPPRLALGDENAEKYKAIGESDRFTLKFVKP